MGLRERRIERNGIMEIRGRRMRMTIPSENKIWRLKVENRGKE